MQLIVENYKIDSKNLKWYATFHNESYYPHVHLVVYSADPSEGYLTRQGIDNMRSVFAHDIFRQEFMCLYERKTEQRDQLKEQAKTSLLYLLAQMQETNMPSICSANGICWVGIYHRIKKKPMGIWYGR